MDQNIEENRRICVRYVLQFDWRSICKGVKQTWLNRFVCFRYGPLSRRRRYKVYLDVVLENENIGFVLNLTFD